MSTEITILERLEQALEKLSLKLEASEQEITRLRNEITIYSAQSEAKSGEIAMLNEELRAKDRELEGVVKRIEEALGR